MPEARHRAARRSAARMGLLGALVSPFTVAALAVGGMVSVTAVASIQEPEPEQASAAAGSATVATLNLDELKQMQKERAGRLSRAGARPAAVDQRVTLVPKAVDHEFATEPLNVWRGPGEQGPKIGVLETGTKVPVTGEVVRGWAQVLMTNPERGRVVRWVNDDYLAENKPEPEADTADAASGSAPATGGQCTNGTSVPSGVSPNIQTIHQAVCAAFPEITTYGTFRSDGEHSQGIAVDIMVSGDRGWQVAEFLRSNYAQFGINYLIYSQQIWSVDRSGEGWRGMEDRGSTTANHYDHVHVTVY